MQQTSLIDYDKLGEAVAKAIQNSPSNRDLWDASDIAAYFKCSEDHAKRRYISNPTFPKQMKIPYSDGKSCSKPFWDAEEVKLWIRKLKNTQSNRRY